MSRPARLEPAACFRCGRVRLPGIIVQGRALCPGCRTHLQRNPSACPGCGAVRVLAFIDEHARRVCAGCVDEQPTYRCHQCGREDNSHGLSCGPCTLRDRATELLTDPATGRIHHQLQPVFDALIASDRPQTALYWLRRPPGHGPRILAQMARGELEISHATFEQLPSDKSHNYLRDLLAAVGVLPAYEARIERMIPWLNQILATLPTEHADIVGRFARWHVIRRLRLKADRDALSQTQIVNGRAQINAVTRFLAWTTEQDTTINRLNQTDLERYLATRPPSTGGTLHGFISWLHTSGINTSLHSPHSPRQSPTVTVSEQQRWDHVDLLLHDDTIRLYTRIGGLFLLLFAQPLTSICRMTTDQVTIAEDGRVLIRFENTPVEMPEPLDNLIREHMTKRGQASYASRHGRWLFPGGIPGNPLVTENIRNQLVERGIKPYNSRKAAMFQLAAQVPTPILSDLLGINTTTAIRWAALAAHDWNSYIASRHQQTRPRKPS